MAEKTSSERDEKAVARFVERYALLLAEAGMPRMASRVFIHLLATDDGKATAAELAAGLHVSPAAISGAVRYLDQVQMIIKARDPGERRDHYEVADDLWYEIYGNRDKMMQSWLSVLADGVEAVGAETPAGHRLDQTRRFVEFLLSELTGLMQRWREQEGRAASPGQRRPR